jgi:hypothetical protein
MPRMTRSIRAARATRAFRTIRHAEGCFEHLEQRTMMSTALSSAFIYSTTASSAAITLSDGGGGITPLTEVSTNLIRMNDFRADSRFSGIDGTGYSAVILDTGIDRNHPFFGADANNNGISDRIVYSYDFANNDADASDVNGHGSNVTSIVASSNSTYRGMAPGANIIHLKVFTDAGGGSFSYVERALQWCIANVNTYNIASINMSLGDSQNWNTAKTLYGISDELASLAALNVITISAAGNSFSSFGSAQGVAYPAADPNSLAVGAVYDRSFGSISYASGATAHSTGADRVTPFSQRHNSLVDVFAPGAPITGAGPTGGTVTQHGTSQAAPHVAGVAVLAQQLAMQVLGRRLTMSEFATLVRTTGDTIVDGDDEADNVTNTGLSFKRMNVLALGEAILAMAPNGPEIAVSASGANIADGSGTSNLGTIMVGGSTTREFTVRNNGNQALTLGDSITVPGGFSVSAGFGSLSLAPGETTTFTIQFSGSTAGTYSGTLSFTSNDADEGTFNFTMRGVVTTTQVLDDGSSGWATAGTWTWAAAGYGGDIRSKSGGNGSGTSTWTFSNLPTGRYRVSVTYVASTNRALTAPYTMSDGSTVVVSRAINQRVAPNDRNTSGAWWEDIGIGNVVSGTMVVRLTDAAAGVIVADAVRIERLGDPVYASEISVSVGSTNITDGGSYSFGSTPVGTSVTRTFTVRNTGNIDLTLADLSVPSGFTMTSDFANTTVAAGGSTTFSVRLGAASIGTFAGSVTMTTNDSDENPFNFSITGVSAGPSAIIDDGATGFSVAGNWTTQTGVGNAGDIRSRAGGGVGNVQALWTFTGLTAGSYRISASWTAQTNRASNAPYTIFDGTTSGTNLSTVLRNQRLAPNDRSISGVWYEDLGTFTLSGSTLTVRLADNANGFVVADAMRIERIA